MGDFVKSSTLLPANSLRLRDFPRGARWTMVAFTALGVLLRIWYQYGRSFAGDEVGTLTLLTQDYRHLLTHFEGWLTMSFYLALLRLIAHSFGKNAWVLVMPSLLAGLATIPLVAALAARLTGARTALLAALLAAVNPYLVFYSVQIRSYMLLVAFTLGGTICFYDWCRQPTWRNGIGCAGCSILALLMHANALYQLVFLAVLFLIWVCRNFQTNRALNLLTRSSSIVVPMLLAVSLAAMAYLPLRRPMSELRAQWSDAPPTPIDYVHFVAELYFAPGFFLIPTVVLLTAGIWRATQDNHALLLLGAGIVTPPIAASFLGVSHFPWAYGRYFIPVLPLLLIFIAEGTSRAMSFRAIYVGWLIVVALIASWIPGLQKIVIQKDDYRWNQVADYLKRDITPADVIVPIDWTSGFHLKPSFDEGDARIVSLDRYLAGLGDTSSTRRVYIVTTENPITAATVQYTIGKVQVVTYTGSSKREIAGKLLDDLRRSLNKRVSPRMASQYQACLDLMAALSLPDEQCEYRTLYYKCLMRTRRQRYARPQMLSLAVDER